MAAFKDEWLVKILLKRNIVDESKIEEIRSTNVPGVQDYLSDKIISLGYIDQNELGKILEQVFNIPFIDLDDFTIDKKVINIIPEEICRNYYVASVRAIRKISNILLERLGNKETVVTTVAMFIEGQIRFEYYLNNRFYRQLCKK